MKWLIWREYRRNRPLLITGGLLLLLPYLAIPSIVWLNDVPISNDSRPVMVFAVSAFYSLFLSPLIISILGGNAFAGERADRSAEFIAYLPIRRWRLLVSKLIVSSSAIALMWGINLLVVFLIFLSADAETNPCQPTLDAFIPRASMFIATSLVFYCVGWLISSFQSSPTFAVAGGLLAPVLVASGVALIGWRIMKLSSQNFEQYFIQNYVGTCFILALVSFALGTWIYLRRSEP